MNREKKKFEKFGRTCAGFCLTVLVACSAMCMRAEEKHVGGEILLKIVGAFADKDRPEWDQAKAEEILEGIIEKENRKDFSWDKIKWETDAKKAAARAEKEQKPIFAYLFLKRNVGPKEAPC